MRNNKLLGLTIASLALAAGTISQAQPYSNAVMALNPVAYLPLNETAPPPMPLSLVANNSGSLGAAGNGYYGAWYQPSGNTWYITNNIVPTNGVTGDGSQALWCQSVYQTAYPGQYVVIPRNTNGVANPAVTIVPPFSIEVWAYVGSTNGANRTLVSEGQLPIQVGGPNAANPYYGGLNQGWAGFALGQYQDYFYFSCYCTNATGNKSSELDSSGYNKFLGARVGQWVHVVATFDGTTEQLWTNGVLAAQKNIGANAAGLRYVPDPTSPLMIGSGNDYSFSSGMTPYSGALDEVAIYPAVLSQSQIQAHYAAVSSGYATTVLADSPSLYYRFDDSVSQANSGYPSATFPVANNYGSVGAAANGVYQPGTTPGVTGPAFAGFGPDSKGVALNGFFGAVDVGGGALPTELNPTGIAPLTVVSWFKSGPADAPGRLQAILGHGDNSYRLTMDQTAAGNRFNPGPGPELQFVNSADLVTNGWALNDGNWHMVAGVSDGTNDYMYLDGTLVKTGTYGTNITITGSARDLLLGGDAQYTYASGGNATSIRNFDGSVAQVAFWTNALSSAQIATLYGAAQVPPSIAFQPAPFNGNAGSAVTLRVGARGSAPLTYQWYKNDSIDTGATGSSLVFNPAAPSDAGSYYVVVRNSSGSVTSSVVQVTLVSVPVITQQSPTSIQVFRGSSPTLRVTAAGPALNYQWSLNGSPLSTGTSSSYTLTNIQSGGTYTCSINNSYGNAAVSPISVTVLTPPADGYPAAVIADRPLAYYRLSETTGTTSFDYVGGLNGIYTNVAQGQTGYSPNDPSDLSAGFGSIANTNSFVGWVPNYLTFGGPTGTSVAFSVEAWVNGGYAPQNSDAGIVTIGTGNGGEQFNLDCGGSDPAHNYRFFVRNAAGSATGPAGTNAPTDGNWHHVVGVCDEPNGLLKLYVDGVLEKTATIGTNAGILSSTNFLSIGSRRSGPATEFDNQFVGSIDEVAVYGYALSRSQILAHYYGSGVAPVMTTQPTNTIANEGGSATFYSAAAGTTPLSYQWYDISSGTTPLLNQTNPTLTLNNIQLSDNGRAFWVVVTNLYGQVVSDSAGLTVVAGPPMLVTDLQPPFSMGYAGAPFTYYVDVSGSGPFTYTWTRNGTAIAGATGSSYSFNTLIGTNLYAVSIHNNQGTISSSTVTNVGFAVPTLNPSDYTYKMKVTFAGYNRSTTLMDFPALLQIGTNTPGFAYSQAAPDGGDIRITDSTGTRELPHEIDEWNPNGVSSIWVQLPSLSGNTNFVWVYWGNPAATTPESWSTNGEVWVPAFGAAPPYAVVYHLKETGFPYADGTTLHTATNGAAPTQAAGVVGTGAAFNGSAWLDAGTNDVGTNFTLSTWVNVNPSATSIQTFWANQHGGYGAPGFAFWVNSYPPPPADQVLDLATGDGSAGNESKTGAGTVPFGSWHFVTAAIDVPNHTVNFYLDGANVGSSSSVVQTLTTLADLRLGNFVDNAFPMHGTMDEARVRLATSSPDWVWADYMTVAQNSTFETYSPIISSTVTLSYTVSGNNLMLSWPQGTLQSAPTVNGTYNDISTPSNTYTVPLDGPQQYFRVKVR